MDEVVNDRKGVSILPSDGIECAIVLYKTKFAILLFYEEDRGSDQRLRRANSTCSEGFLEESVHLSLFDQRHGVDFAETGLRVVFELDRVVPLSLIGQGVKRGLIEDIREVV